MSNADGDVTAPDSAEWCLQNRKAAARAPHCEFGSCKEVARVGTGRRIVKARRHYMSCPSTVLTWHSHSGSNFCHYQGQVSTPPGVHERILSSLARPVLGASVQLAVCR